MQFLVIGACIYGAYAIFGAPDENISDTTIVVDSNRINAMISQWEGRWNRLPTRTEIEGLIQTYIREDLLYRQALAMGLNKDDPVTRRRMAQKLEFLTSDISAMQQPKKGELEQYFTENAEKYRYPDRISFIQLFFDPDKRGDTTLSDAAKALAQLQSAGVPDAATIQAGDRLILQYNFKAATEQQVSRQLGSDFSKSVMKLEPGSWYGPVTSGYGVHLVYVYQFHKAPSAKFKEFGERVLADWHEERRLQFNAEFLESLMNRYKIVIDEIPAERLLDVRTEVTGENLFEGEPATTNAVS